MSSPARFHYMDNLRALAMLSGVGFHAALAYSPLTHPFIPTADRAQSPALDVGIWLLHLFRMPLFFLVAGFFAAMLVARRGLGGLFRNRLRRIALPFVLFWPLVYWSLQHTTLQATATVRHPGPLLLLIRQFAQMPNPPALPPGTSHLWFLYYLMFFYVLVWSAKNFPLQKLAGFVRELRPAWLLGVMPLLLVPALASVSAPNPAPESFLPQFWAFGYFGPFFAFGYLLHGQEDMLERLRPYASRLLVGSLLLYGVFWYLLQAQPATASDPNATPWMAAVEAYISVWMTLTCLLAGKRWLSRGNPVLRYLSDASYWTYLVHLPVLFALQYRLLDLDLSWGLKFCASVLATFAICLLSYQAFVRRTRIGQLLGKAVPA
jgi:glucan biosynthesis protein C